MHSRKQVKKGNEYHEERVSYVRDGDYFDGNEVARFDTREDLPTKEDIAQRIREESNSSTIKMTSKSFQNTVWGYEIQMENYNDDGGPIDVDTIEDSECGVWEA